MFSFGTPGTSKVAVTKFLSASSWRSILQCRRKKRMSPGQKDIGKFMQRNIPWLQMPDSAFTAFTAAHKLLTSNLRRKIERFVKEAVEVVERFVEENARHFVAVIIVGYDPSIGGTEMLY